MKKAFLLIALLLISFWCINVKADDETALPIATDPESAEIEKQEEVKEEEKKEVVKAEAKAEPTRGDADEPTVGKVNVKIIDSRTKSIIKTVELLSIDESNTTVSLKNLFPSMTYNYSSKSFIINETLYTHKFLGFYDAEEGGNQIVFSYNNTVYPELSTIRANATQTSTENYKLTLKAKSDLTTESAVNIYARFETTAKPNGKITVNVIDTRNGNVVNSLITYATDGGTNADNSKTVPTIFPNMYVSGSNLEDKLDGRKYIFKGFYTSEEGTTKITKSFTPGDVYPELGTLKVSNDLTYTNWQNVKLQALSKNTNNVDKTYNVYALWDKKKSTKLTVVFKELSESGTVLNDTQNEVALSVTNIIDLGNGQTQKSVNLKVTEFISGDYKYVVDGWYEEDGKTPVPESMYVNGNPLQIKVPFTCTNDSPDELTLTYVLVWKEYRNPIYKFNIVDKVSDGSHKWDNTTGHFGSYTHTFKAPSEKTHYQFLYYKMNDIIKNAGEEYSHDISAQGYDTSVEETFDAYWQPDVTLDLYDENTKLISSESSFESVSINYNTDKVGYKFLGWFDKDGNKVEETTFYPNEMGIKPEPKQITLYAKYELILIDVSVAKEWDDEGDQDCLRPDSINVTLSNGTTVTLNEENKWTATVKDVPEYEDGEKVNYTWTEETPEGYELTDTIFDEESNLTTLINTHIPKLIEITVTKVWSDDDNESGKRPESVTIALVVDEEEIDTVELNEENKWTHTFTELPAYSNKEEINYEVRELEVPEGYEVSYEETEDGYIIHNVLGQGEGEPDEPTNNPQTGDNIGLYVIGLMTSLSGLVVCVKKYNFE